MAGAAGGNGKTVTKNKKAMIFKIEPKSYKYRKIAKFSSHLSP